MNFPIDERILKALENLKDEEGSLLIDRDTASLLELAKASLCEELIKFKRIKKYNLEEMAKMANLSVIDMKKVLHYRVLDMSITEITNAIISITISHSGE